MTKIPKRESPAMAREDKRDISSMLKQRREGGWREGEKEGERKGRIKGRGKEKGRKEGRQGGLSYSLFFPPSYPTGAKMRLVRGWGRGARWENVLASSMPSRALGIKWTLNK